jgi:hypothetical protein
MILASGMVGSGTPPEERPRAQGRPRGWRGAGGTAQDVPTPPRPAPPPAPRRLQLRATGRVGECCAGGCAEPPGCGRRCSVRPGAGCETLGPVAAERRARADALQVLRATWTRLVWRARPYAGNHGCRGHRVAHVLWPGSETRDRTESLELGWERDAKWVAGLGRRVRPKAPVPSWEPKDRVRRRERRLSYQPPLFPVHSFVKPPRMAAGHVGCPTGAQDRVRSGFRKYRPGFWRF